MSVRPNLVVNGQFRVTGYGLPVRATASHSARMVATLPFGTIVLEIRDPAGTSATVSARRNEWMRVSAAIDGRLVEGFVARTFMEPVPPHLARVPEAHLDKPPGTVKRSGLYRAYRLNEDPMPRRQRGSKDVAALGRLIAWFDVERSQRYQPAEKTYCNIYAYDFAHLAGGYIPRVWWSDRALLQLRAGQSVLPDWGKTVFEQNANMLFDWLSGHGPQFGWRRVSDMTEAQDAANAGKLVTMCAKRVVLKYSGHISVIVPETATEKAERKDGKVTAPLQSQAGRNNHKYYTANWGISKEKWQDRGIWVLD